MQLVLTQEVEQIFHVTLVVDLDPDSGSFRFGGKRGELERPGSSSPLERASLPQGGAQL
jgi:hypothetical protein